ncbi:endoribonuclease Dicer [Copidosoma floridanum]|uniref:endoribonuclease Dicer n=1 Tax=Copidosoma floridanum TaxID=29053 RepID=UPI000C6FBDFB|nr:endoribonuclease Dicer [Copidosoma floridanum]
MGDESPQLDPSVDKKNFTPRPYQIQLYQQASRENSIIYLPTGTGKTFIAVLLIKHMSGDVIEDYRKSGKRTIFIVNTVTLVHQQSAFLNRHTGLVCKGYSGDMQVDFWMKEQWYEELYNNQVLVMTAQIFVNILLTGVMSLKKVNLLIFDECHRAVKDHPMRQIMQMFEKHHKDELPRVLAMSASLLNSNVKLQHVDVYVKDLEATFHSKVTTVESLEQVSNFATNPHERIVYYESPPEIDIPGIKYIMDTAKVVLENLDIPNKSRNLASSHVFSPQSKTVKLSNLLTDVIDHIKEMGLYGGNISILYHLIQCERLKRYSDDQKFIYILDFIITQLCKIQKMIGDKLKNFKGKDLILRYSTPKVIKLVSILKDYYSRNNDKKFCCIIFVQKRFTAKVLYKILQDLGSADLESKFILPEFIVGYNNDPYKNPGELECLARWNKQALARFRSGIKNCLVATDVVDEGVDIPSCTLVIRYYAPMDFRAYIQSKGRARHSTSHFIILAENQKDYDSRYNNYVQTENFLRRMLHGNTDARSQPSAEEIAAVLYDYNIPPYRIRKKDGSMSIITEQSSIQLVNSYCASLLKSQFIMLSPAWVLKSRNTTKISEDCKEYSVEITLPPVSPLKETICGDYMESIDLAKRSAAMKTCIRLYEIGELTENLQPRRPEDAVESVDYLFPYMRDEFKDKANMPGTKGKKRRYFFKYPEALKAAYPQAGKKQYLHVLKMKPMYAQPMDNRHNAFYKLLKNDDTFAILSSKRMPEMFSFPIFLNVGEIEVSVVTNKQYQLPLTHNEIESLKCFQYTIFEKIIENGKNFLHFDQGAGDYSFLLVPINESETIDWGVVNTVVTEVNCCYSGKIKSVSSDLPMVLKNSIYDSALIFPKYRNPIIYIVTEVCIDKKAESPFPQDNYTTYVNYYREKHQIHIKYPKQPLLEVKQISKKINCIKPRAIKPNSTRKKRAYETEDFEEHMVPELCERYEFPSVYWLKATTLPSILHRISQWLIAEELRNEIAAYMYPLIQNPSPNHKWEPLKVDETSNIFEKKEKRYDVDDDDDDDYGDDDDDVDDKNVNGSDRNGQVPKLTNVELGYAIINQEMGSTGKELLDIERYPENANILSIEEEKKIFTSLVKDLSEVKIQEKAKKETNRKHFNVPVPPLKMLRSVNKHGPSPVDIMKSLTAKMSNDFFDLERSETLGDSFLKYAVSLYLFQNYPNFGEGSMTYLKGKLVGNLNLYYCGENKKLGGRMKIEDFVPSTSPIPAFVIPNEIKKRVYEEEIASSVLYEMSIPKTQQITGCISADTVRTMHEKIDKWKKATSISGMEHYFGFQVVSDKTVSDCVEALIGTYLLNLGIPGALKILMWFNILPQNLDEEKYLHPTVPDPRLGLGNVNEHLPLADKIEKNLGYKFNNRAFLLQSLNLFTAKVLYKILQDLDFLLTVHIFETCGNLSPGELTDLRSALVNNITFACLAVKYELHASMLMHAPKMFDLMDRFIRFQEARNYAVDDELLWVLLEEEDCNMSEHVDVPKVLGDIFESVIGAILLDCNMNLTVVWQVIYRLMKSEIDLFSQKVPKQPIRVIYETTGANPVFSKGQIMKGTDAIMITLTIISNGEKKRFHGFGSTKKLAQCAAAKQALKYLRYRK